MTPSEPPDPAGRERPEPAPHETGTPDPPGIPGISGIPGAPGAPGRPRPRQRRVTDPWQLWIHRAEQIAVGRAQHMPIPAWMRKTPGERRWPVTLTVIVAITLQLLLPPHLTEPLPRALLPALEGALLIGLSIANPVRIERRGKPVRVASIVLILLMTIANAASAVLLIHAILRGHSRSPGPGRCWPAEPRSGSPTSSRSRCGTGSSTGAARSTARSAPRSIRTCCSPRWQRPNCRRRTGSHGSWTTSTCRSPTPPRSARPT